MPWFYVDDGFSDSKPVLNMPDRYRLAACGLWTLAGSWSAKEELDGFVPDSKLRQLGARPQIIAALTDPGQLSAALCTQVEGGIQCNSWGKWQKTRAELNEKRQQDAERQRKWREAHPDESPPRKVKGRNAVASINCQMSHSDSTVTDTVTNSVTNGVTDALVTRDASRARARGPDPTRPDPIPSVVTSEGETHVSSADEPPPPTCPTHRNHTDPPPCRACRAAREHRDTFDAEQARRRTQARTEFWRTVAECADCDDAGWVDAPAGLARCACHDWEATNA